MLEQLSNLIGLLYPIMGFGTTYDTHFLILFKALLLFRVTAMLRQINLTVRAHKENWLVFIYSLTLQIVLITTNIVNIGLGSENVIKTQTRC